MSQEIALEKIKAGGNVCVLGKSGTGKSTLIREITDESTIVVAPTGIAALNVTGGTMHSVFGLPLGVVLPQDKFKIQGKFKELFSSNVIKRIILDEISLCRADYLDLINDKLQVIKGNDKPFGDLQMITFGDFHQIEPIVSWRDEELFYKTYDSPFAFSAKAWNFNVVELTKIYRQSDERQKRMLNSISIKDKHHKLALQRIQDESLIDEDCEDAINLCCYKKDAKKINDTRLKQLQTRERVYKASMEGKDLEWKDAPVDKELKLKIGARVMIASNDPLGNYANGQIGEG